MIVKRNRTFLIVAFLVAVPVFAAKFWETKDFTTWTEKECTEVLSKSPWAYSNSFGDVAPIGDQTAGIERRSSGTGMPEPSFGQAESTQVFEFRLLTAKPIRMALARMQLLQKPADPAAMEQVMRYVNTPPEKEIVIQIGYRTVPTGSSAVHDIHRYFLGASVADFRTTTSLASKESGVVPIAAYLPPGTNRSFPAFVFPRLSEAGKPNFTAETKEITFRSEFTPVVGSKRMTYNIFVKMNPKKMMFKEELTF